MASTTIKPNQGTPNFEKARDEANTATEKVKDAAGHLGQAASSAASAVTEKAKDVAGQVGHAVSGAAETVSQKAGDATHALGSGIRTLGDKVRDNGPNDGMMGKATESVASALEQSGKYLEDKGLAQMTEDITGLIKQHPIPAVLIGIGIGFLLARTMRS